MADKTRELHVFTNGTDSVIAYDIDDARELWAALYGESLEDYPRDEWYQEADDARHKIWCDADGRPCEINEDCGKLVDRSCAEWIAAEGRGFLCSTEF